MINLEPVKSGRIDNTAISRAFGKISKNRSFVARRPITPKQLHFVASLDRDTCICRLGTLVASNIRSVVLGRGNESKILVQR